MTNQDLANRLTTEENRAAWKAAADKSLFVQGLIEAEGIATYPASPLCDFIEDHLAGVR